jgi:hypothetical protein
MISEKISLSNAFFSSDIPGDMGFDVKNLYFPIPTSETDANPNITQNSGY